MRRAFAQHLEDDHGIAQQRAATWDRAAGHEGVGGADAVHCFDLEAVAVRLPRRAGEAIG